MPRKSKELSKLLFNPLELQAPAISLEMVPQKESPSGWTVWWGPVVAGLCTSSQNRTQTEADFGKHPMPHQHPWRRLWDVWRGTYFPWPIDHHRGRQHATASTIKSTTWWWLPSSEMFIRITVPLLSGPWGRRTPCQPLALAHCHHSRAGFQIPTALPFLATGPTKLHPLVGLWPIPALTHPHPIPREVPGDQGWGCPQPTGPHGDSPAPSPQKQPPMQCPDMYFLLLCIYLLVVKAGIPLCSCLRNCLYFKSF